MGTVKVAPRLGASVRWALSTALALGLVWAGGEVPSAAAEEHGIDRIVYWAEEARDVGDDPAHRIMVVDDDGGNAHTIDAGKILAPPSWSPDGHELAWVRSEETNEGSQDQPVNRLVVAAADGSNQRVVAEIDTGRLTWGPVWSPNGRRWALSSGQEGLFVVDRDGNTTQVTDPEEEQDFFEFDGEPGWNPDGDQLVFTRTRVRHSGDDTAEVRILEIASGSERKLADGDLPEWSPDGHGILYRARQGGFRVIRPDGTGDRLVAAHQPCLFAPHWSPDGTRITCGGHDGLEVVDVATGERQTVFTGSQVGQADWSADGTRLVFTVWEEDARGPDQPSTNLHVARSDGSDLRRVTDEDYGSAPDYRPGPTVRLSGPNRVETAVRVSQDAFDDASAVVLARADLYPDALAAAPVAASLDAPVLLTGSDRLHPSVRDEVARLGATRAHLMGDTTALSPQVEADLRQAGVQEITRSAGETRFDTARLAASMTPARHVYIVEGANPDPGRGWPDAVAVASLAAHQRHPILLVTRDQLPDATLRALRDLDATTATIVGSSAAVSTDVQRSIEAEGITVDRLAGATRYHTSVAVADASVAAGMDASTVRVSTGRNWPDSLTAGPASARAGGVFLLVDGRSADPDAPGVDWLTRRSGTVQRLPVLGGPDVIEPRTTVTLDRAVTQ